MKKHTPKPPLPGVCIGKLSDKPKACFCVAKVLKGDQPKVGGEVIKRLKSNDRQIVLKDIMYDLLPYNKFLKFSAFIEKL